MNWLHDIHWVLAWRTPGLTHLAFGLTWLGYSGFLMFFMVLGYWCVSQKLFYRLLLLLAINGISNAYLKDVFQQPRPPLAWRLDDLVGQSYGLPSGHAQMGVAIWLWLAWQIRRPWAWVLFPTLALGICASRIYLGAHDLEQVLVGGALGALSVLLLQGLLNLIGDWRPPLAVQLGAIVLACGLALLSWPGEPPSYVPALAVWLTVVTALQPVAADWTGYRVPQRLPLRLAAGLLGALGFLAEQKLLALLGPSLGLPESALAAVHGLAHGLTMALLIPCLLARMPGLKLGATPGS